MTDLKLAIFDVDGTLVDSQGDILASMKMAFASLDQPSPPRDAVLGIIGLSLPEAMARLAPELPEPQRMALVETYKDSYAQLRRAGGAASSPLYPGIAAMLGRLHGVDPLLLGVATGKSRRGLTALFDSIGMASHFVTTQVADNHPSKPHPSMLLTCLAETGIAAKDAVMIGDTTYDMQMAQAAGIGFIGVSWGYHPASQLTAARAIAADADSLEQAIRTELGV